MEQLKNKKNIIAAAVLLIVALLSFYCGTFYSKDRSFHRDGFKVVDRHMDFRGALRDGGARVPYGMMGAPCNNITAFQAQDKATVTQSVGVQN